MVQPSPFPAAPPPPAALTSGVMMLLVNARISVLKARAMTRPTAMTINSPCIRKLRKPLSMPHSPAVVPPCDGTILGAPLRDAKSPRWPGSARADAGRRASAPPATCAATQYGDGRPDRGPVPEPRRLRRRRGRRPVLRLRRPGTRQLGARRPDPAAARGHGPRHLRGDGPDLVVGHRRGQHTDERDAEGGVLEYPQRASGLAEHPLDPRRPL